MITRKQINLLIILLSAFISSPALVSAQSGASLWEADFVSGLGSDKASALAIGPEGELAITGHTRTEEGNLNFVTVLYAADGRTLWSRQYDHSWLDSGRAVGFTPSGNVLVAGTSQNLDSPKDLFLSAYYSDFRIVEYDGEGEIRLEATSSGYEKNNEPYSLAVDRQGNTYVAGVARSSADSFFLFYTAKFDRYGAVLWEKFEDWGADAYATGIAIAPDGTVVVAGYYYDGTNPDPSIRVLFYEAETGLTLKDLYYDKNRASEKAWGLAIDRAGNIIIAGETSVDDGVSPPLCTFLLKYSQSGELLWAKVHKESRYRNYANAVAADARGRIYVAGRLMKPMETSQEPNMLGEQLGNPLGGDWMFLAFEPSGRLILERDFGYGGDNAAEDIAVAPTGEILITGSVKVLEIPSVIRTVRLQGFQPPTPESSPAPSASGATGGSGTVDAEERNRHPQRPTLFSPGRIKLLLDPSETTRPFITFEPFSFDPSFGQ